MTLAHGYAVADWLFLRLLALLYLIAFVSLAVQIRGLVGSNGIVPADMLRRAHTRGSLGSFAAFPTLSRLIGSDAALLAQCWVGAALAAALFFGVCPVMALVLCWMLYLSLSNACGVFLGYQWDALLTEMGLLAVLLAPPVAWAGLTQVFAPPWAGRSLLVWLLFRLVFSSAVSKLRSGDVMWRNLTALRFHFETQPLPNALSWYAHQLPTPVQRAQAAMMFAIELGAPFLLLAGPPFAYVGAVAIVCLMVAVEATGNFAFFNLQTIALCVLAVDDAVWRTLLPHFAVPATAHVQSAPPWWSAVVTSAAAGLFLLSLVPMVQLVAPREAASRRFVRFSRALASFRIVNGYGLFAVMTTARPEIIIEGSNDSEEWLAYEFRWKPGDPRRRPRTAAPHQPRLDWQMWFAALGGISSAPWFRAFLERLLEGSPEVLGLLEHDPFGGRPPAYVRALLYEYRFTSRDERARTGAWWTRDLVDTYYPAVTRHEPEG